MAASTHRSVFASADINSSQESLRDETPRTPPRAEASLATPDTSPDQSPAQSSSTRITRSASIALRHYNERPSRLVRRCNSKSIKDDESRSSTSASSALAATLRPFKSMDSTATVLLGSEETPFLIHQSILTTASPFFAAAINGSFTEGITQTLKLPDIEPKHFEHIALWLYTHRLESPSFFFKDGKPTYFSLLDLYEVADRLDLEGMRNALVDMVAALAEETNSVPTPSDTFILYEEIRENSAMRRLILDLFAFKKTENLVQTHPDEWHPQFLRDLVCKLKRPYPATSSPSSSSPSSPDSGLSRHDTRAWKPMSWQTTKACLACATVLKPGVVAYLCASGCQKAWCGVCYERGDEGGVDWGCASERECRPWLRGMCKYHEHSDEFTAEKCAGRKWIRR